MRRYRQVLDGLRFGMLLQLAVGPVCLLIFHGAATHGLAAAWIAVLAVAMVDALYIALALLGATAMLRRRNIQLFARWAGGLVLILFGLDMALQAIGIRVSPAFRLFSANPGGSLFGQALLLTLSNPLTVLFWGGVLTGKVQDGGMQQAELLAFAVGCVLATLVFLSFIAILGTVLVQLLPPVCFQILNALVGLAVVYFGIRMLTR